ncbi:MAG: sigma-70 family RNA polymerase sigma factor [Syntrophobacteraceae bacterium]
MSSSEPNAERREDSADIAAYLAGDRAALDRLVLRHKDSVFNLCYRLLGDYGDAEECAQETFVKVLRSIAGFRREASFSTWLFTIAVNTCKNKRKSSEYRFWKHALRLGRNPRDDDGPEEFEIEDQTPSALAQMTEKEREILLQSAIDSLPYDYRTVIVLRHVEELPYDEIARITGYNLGTLKSKLARARIELQKKLRGA